MAHLICILETESVQDTTKVEVNIIVEIVVFKKLKSVSEERGRKSKGRAVLYRFVKEIFFQEIWAIGKIIYFIYKIIFFFLNLTEIKKFKFCFLKKFFQNSDENKCFKLV